MTVNNVFSKLEDYVAIKKNIVITLIIILLGLIGCSSDKNCGMKTEKFNTWKQNLIKHRTDKDKEFKTALDSPMAGVARFYIFPEKEEFIALINNKLEKQGETCDNCFFSATFKDNFWQLNNMKNNVKVIDGKLSDGKIDSYALLNFGRFSFSLYPSNKRLTVIAFDKKREKLLHFKGLLYFEANCNFVVKAKVEKLPKPEPITVYTTRNEEKTYYRYSYLHFKINNKNYKLTAFKYSLNGEGSDMLFVPFRDLTSGVESYGAGRYLELKEPKEDTLTLDFNYAFNPLCNYSNGYNCPLAPAENVLDCKILAGEKAYPHE